MDAFRVLEIKKSVFENNDRQADLLREELKRNHTFLLNLMSSPGSGKTTTLMATINALKDDLRIGVMEADIDSDVDAATISTSGAKVIQLHTGGMCHLDAGMTRQGLEGLGTENIDLAILENVGNLVCPAEFDTGAVKNAMILSVPEGDDKPLKYPLMFSICDVLLVNKIDLLPREQVMQRLLEWQQRFDFDEIIPLSALKQDNVDELLRVIDGYLQEGIKYFPDDMVSDHGENFRIAEIIREKILFRTEEEVPHSIAVVIENREEDETQVFLQAMVIVERPSQKSILIGKQGSMIRSIRIAAQRELRQMLGKRVELELYVRVEENWRNRESKLKQFGYNEHE